MHLTEALILKTIFKNFSRIIFLISFQTIICAGNIFGADNILSPEVTVKNYVDAYIAQDWEACTGYLHPEMLQKLHNRIIDMFDEVSTFTRDKLLKQYRVRSVRELQAIPPPASVHPVPEKPLGWTGFSKCRRLEHYKTIRY